MTTYLVFRDFKYFPSLNTLLRMNRHRRRKLQHDLKVLIMEQTRNRHWGKVTLCYVRHHSNFMDWDNFGASFKLAGDALVQAAVIKDDSPKIIHDFFPKQHKCRKPENRIVIQIKDY